MELVVALLEATEREKPMRKSVPVLWGLGAVVSISLLTLFHSNISSFDCLSGHADLSLSSTAPA